MYHAPPPGAAAAPAASLLHGICSRAVRVAIVCPVPPGSRLGNRITALRWRRMIAALGHQARIVGPDDDPRCDVLIALHARRSAEAVRRSRARHPERSVVVALTGTDLHRDIHRDARAQRSLELADHLVVLHAGATAELPARHRKKARLVPQSAPPARRQRPRARTFEVAVVAHLRPVKDPLRTARAARLLPASSRVSVVHAGRALTPAARRAALAEQRANPRYVWLGELSPARARALIARARIVSLTSEAEGGANVVSEALAAGTPVVASRIACTEALLGRDYPGLFPFGSSAALAALLARAEDDPRFLAELARRCRARRALVSAPRERAALAALLAECPRTRGRRAERP
jgi:putative glycosyltransferase (TIGR04348 family)